MDVLVGERTKPEGKVRIQQVKRLIRECGFPASHIDINIAAGVGRDAGKRNIPVRADVVVYRDANKTKPFAVIETKAPNEKTGVAQAESYARNLGAEYHLWSDGTREAVFRTSRYPNQSEPIARLPVWVTDKPIVKKVPKTQKLRPFKDEEELRQVIGVCHDLILEKLGHDPAKAFDEMTKLLFLKLYDEREVPAYYEFAALASDEPKDVADRLRKLFAKAVSSSKYRDVFYSKFNQKVDISLELDDFTIFGIIQKLQGFSLVGTTENIHGADIKGTVYEQMVGNTFRGELAQFFTPRKIVEFMVALLKPSKDDRVFDPACGSGGFLIMVLRYLSDFIKENYPNLSEADRRTEIKYFAENNLFGTDINDRMTRVAKMNMIMHGDGHGGIFNTNGLLTDPDLPEILRMKLKEGKVTVILSNPPFAGREKDPLILKQFKLGVNKNGKPISVSKEILFIEGIIDLLREEGKAGLVLPSGIFNNKSLKRVRDYIKANCRILALIALPEPAFVVSGAHNEGNLLFIQKVKEIPKDYDFFIDWAENVGFDATGREYSKNDLPKILERFKHPPRRNIMKFSELEDRIDPWYYHPTYKRIQKEVEKSPFPSMRITDVVEKSKNLVDKRKTPQKEVRYIETNDVDLIEGEIVSWKSMKCKELPNRATYILEEGDLLIPNHRHCIRGVAVVSKKERGVVCTNRFFVVQPKLKVVRADYLINVLKQPEILTLMIRHSTGEINPTLNWWGLERIKIPIPDLETQDKILSNVEKKKVEVELLKSQMEVRNLQIKRMLRDGISFAHEIRLSSKLGSEHIAEVRFKPPKRISAG